MADDHNGGVAPQLNVEKRLVRPQWHGDIRHPQLLVECHWEEPRQSEETNQTVTKGLESPRPHYASSKP